MKVLKFSPDLIPLILSGKKTSTWRLWDDKDLQVGDQLNFIDSSTGKTFGFALITSVIEKRSGELTASDKKGHEKFKSDEEMYKSFNKYYQKDVGPETIIKIVRFDLLKPVA